MNLVLEAQAIPFLPRGVRLHWCGIREMWFIQAPERAVKLDAIAAAILERVDGQRSLTDIVDALAADFAAPRDQIDKDVRSFLTDLTNRRMLEMQMPATDPTAE